MKKTSLNRERGSALMFTLVLMTLLMGLSVAQTMVQMTNVKQSRFFIEQKLMHRYAESGLGIGAHEIRNSISEFPGMLGTEYWSETYDVGEDGISGTRDLGEGDGIPTPGEPKLIPVATGPMGSDLQLIVYSDTPLGGIQRVVATCFNDEGSVTVEKYLRVRVVTIPKVGAAFVSPGIAIDIRGQNAILDGNDHDLNGNLIAGADPYPALATSIGDVPGENANDLLAQLNADDYDQIVGLGGEPSIGEVDPIDIDELTNLLQAVKTVDLPGGTYTNPLLGDLSVGDIPVTYVNGNMLLSGTGTGAGVLVVDGNLKITGEFSFKGLIVVRGDVILSGGGSTIHVIGSLTVGESITALDNSDLTLGGHADLLFSSEAIDIVQGVLNGDPQYEGVYYKED